MHSILFYRCSLDGDRDDRCILSYSIVAAWILIGMIGAFYLILSLQLGW